MCASRKERSGGVELLVREGLTNKERPDLGIFEEGLFESVFVEIVRGGGCRNDVVGVFYREHGVRVRQNFFLPGNPKFFTLPSCKKTV